MRHTRALIGIACVLGFVSTSCRRRAPESDDFTRFLATVERDPTTGYYRFETDMLVESKEDLRRIYEAT